MSDMPTMRTTDDGQVKVEAGTTIEMWVSDWQTGTKVTMRATFTHEFYVVPGASFDARIDAVKAEPAWVTAGDDQ